MNRKLILFIYIQPIKIEAAFAHKGSDIIRFSLHDKLIRFMLIISVGLSNILQKTSQPNLNELDNPWT